MAKIYPDVVEIFYWEEVVPQIEDLLSVKPLELPTARGVSNWKSIDFLHYWQKRHHEEHGFRPQIVNKFKTSNVFKNKVIDYFYDRVNDEIKTFIDWVVTTKTVKQSKAEFLPFLLNDYMAERVNQKFKLADSSIEQTSEEMTKLSEKATLEYYGVGYNDAELTKEEYLIGLKWREENLTPEAIHDIEKWHEKKFKTRHDILQRLTRWKEEFEAIKNTFNLMKEFYQLEAKKTKKSLKDVLKHYHVKDPHLYDTI
jgi:hypothetical protein